MLILLLMFLTLVVSFLIIVYFLPTIIAVHRQHHNRVAIFVLNLLFGWSFVGWGIALVWSVTRVFPIRNKIIYA